jgi:membrane protein
VIARVMASLEHDDAVLAAGVAFHMLLALVPALIAVASLYGLIANPADIQRHVDDVPAAAPRDWRFVHSPGPLPSGGVG